VMMDDLHFKSGFIYIDSTVPLGNNTLMIMIHF